jgi:hypothetical protein
MFHGIDETRRCRKFSGVPVNEFPVIASMKILDDEEDVSCLAIDQWFASTLDDE